MLLSRDDGLINKFITIEDFEQPAIAYTYITYQALYYSESDPDGLPYIYAAYLMESDIHFIRFENKEELEMGYVYFFGDGGATAYLP